MSIGDASADEGNPEYFGVSLSGPATATCSVHWRTLDGTARAPSPYNDYTSASGWIGFSIGQSVAGISIPTHPDTLDEGDEHFSVILDDFVNLSAGRSVGNATIIDNDLPAISIDDRSAHEQDGNMIFLVALSNPSVFNIGVNYNTQDGTATAGQDYTERHGQATILAGALAATISVPITDDYLAENDEDFSVVLTSATRGTIVDNSGTGTILDNDRWWAQIVATDDSAYEPDRNGQHGDPGQFRVTRYGATNRRYPLVVDYVISGTAENGVDYQTIVNSVPIPANSDYAVIDVTPLYDGQDYWPESVTLVLSQPEPGPGGQPRYTVGALNSAAVTIATNERPLAYDDGPYMTLRTVPLTVPTAGVLANDYDVENDPLTALIDRPPYHGSTNLSTNGSFTYTPDGGFMGGSDSFTYKARDAWHDSIPATVNLEVADMRLYSVTYQNTHTIARDSADGQLYSFPQWLDEDGDGSATGPYDTKYPVCYTRAQTLSVSAEFRLDRPWQGGGIEVTLTGPHGISLPWTPAHADGNVVTLDAVIADGSLRDTVYHYDDFEMNWFARLQGGGPTAVSKLNRNRWEGFSRRKPHRESETRGMRGGGC